MLLTSKAVHTLAAGCFTGHTVFLSRSGLVQQLSEDTDTSSLCFTRVGGCMQEIEMGGSSVAIAAVQDAIARGMLASFFTSHQAHRSH